MRVCFNLIMHPLRKSDQTQYFQNACAVGSAVERADNFEIFICGEIQVKIWLLDNAADRAKGGIAMRSNRMTEQLNIPRRGLNEGKQHADGRALAGTVGTEKAKHIAAMDFEVKIADSPSLLVLLA